MRLAAEASACNFYPIPNIPRKRFCSLYNEVATPLRNLGVVGGRTKFFSKYFINQTPLTNTQ